LVDLVKYDSLIRDLSAIESEIATLGNKLQDTLERKTELEIQIAKLKQDNSFLQKKIVDIEQELVNMQQQEEENNIINSLNNKERESLKQKIQDLISKIDGHLSS